MKRRILVLAALLLLCSMLVSCLDGIFPGTTPTPEDKPAPEDKPTPEDPTPDEEENNDPVIKDDSVVIFSADTAFTLVYPAADAAVAGSVASAIKAKIEALGLKSPKIAVDEDKRATQCELVIGATERAISSRAEAKISKSISADPGGCHWVWFYQTGRLALYANSEKAYLLAVEELTTKYMTNGEILMKTDAKDVGYLAGPHEAYMEYDIPDNFYDGYTDPFADMVTDYKKMTLTRASEGNYRISYVDERGGKYTVTFVKKKWGVWMFGPIGYTENDGTYHAINPAYTDNEFVSRMGGKTEVTARGGNHGDYPKDSTWKYYVDDTSYYNDMLLDLTFYDARSGEKIVLDTIGGSIQADGSNNRAELYRRWGRSRHFLATADELCRGRSA